MPLLRFCVIVETFMESAPVATISSLAHGGYGVCRIDGQVCFVARALPGDVIRVDIARETKGVLWGSIAEILEPSQHRIEPVCEYFGICGGCSWLHCAPEAQGEWKCKIVQDCFQRIAKIDCDISYRENADLRLGYRTRAEFHAEKGLLGFYAPESHKVIDIERCPLFHEKLNAALEKLRGLRLKESIEVTINPEGEQVMLAAKRPPRSLRESFKLVNDFDDLKPARFLFDGVPIVNGAFSQSSLLLNRMLVETVARMCAGAASVLDLYCGNGNLTMRLPDATDLWGLDHKEQVVKAASSMGCGEYRAGDEAEFRRALKNKWDAIVLDPPRTGAKAIADALAGSDCPRIVYVSCDPATLARDLKTITARGWRVAETVAIDLFPNTPHVETVCKLERA
jgi:23S rRNA (uracil1939-C5)-methyltransferase